ncbi:MAG: agmatine deiminase family protein [Ignavibacteriaceae bacterium]|nr:agmatine deiminase family protein [Ignavibacteriaceae bacterium]
MPAEWEKHEATIIAWPHNKNDWPGKFTPIHWVYAEIVKRLSYNEKVIIITRGAEQKATILAALKKNYADTNNVDFLIRDTDRSWMRDTSPAFVSNIGGERIAVHFRFNGWAKYDNWKKDYKIPASLASKIKIPVVKAEYNNKHVVLEGGGIDSNGYGTLLTTEECLLDPKQQVRNPGFTAEDYTSVFKQYMGIEQIIWLGKGIAGDDTHGHIDDLCRFVNKNTVLLCLEKNEYDENYTRLKENEERLQGIKLHSGEKLNVIPLPMPEPLWFDGMRLPASYANFYIANNTVLVPTFNDPSDKDALGIISEVFPGRKTVGINSVDLVWGLGTLHCLTHELPA